MTKERPILFSAPMVRAILEGRKTQTRRVAKPREVTAAITRGLMGGTNPAFGPCPYGQPGDRLWVRETWRIERRGSDYFIDFAADTGSPSMTRTVVVDAEALATKNMRWRPSIHMPRWASRITLDVKTVRVERLQDISEADANAEGGLSLRGPNCFQCLWESINGPDSWDANPWVWVIEFERVNEDMKRVTA